MDSNIEAMDSSVEFCGRPTTTPLARSGRGAGGEGDQAPEHEATSGDPLYVAHETALVEQPSTIGPRTRIGRFAHVKPGATIGADCDLGQNVVIGSTAVIGDGVKIGNNVVVDDGVVLEDGVFCGPGVVFATVVKPRSECLDACERQPIVVRRGASLGANATIVGGSTVGEFAMVGAGTVVTGYVCRYAVVAGVPAREIGWLCRCTKTALNFETVSVNKCPACGRHYRLQFHHGLSEFSPEEERARDRQKHLEHLARFIVNDPAAKPYGYK